MANFQSGLKTVNCLLGMPRTAEHADSASFNQHDRHPQSMVRASAARTLNTTSRQMGQQLCSLLGRKLTDRPKLFEMSLTAYQRHGECLDEEKRDRLTATRLKSGLAVVALKARAELLGEPVVSSHRVGVQLCGQHVSNGVRDGIIDGPLARFRHRR